MKRMIHGRLGALLPLAVSACTPASAQTGAGAAEPSSGQAITITTAQERGSMEGSAEWFTGKATVSMLFSPGGARDFSGATVSFEPGARTVWHSHPAGQTLVVTEGTGWVQIEGDQRRELKPGDVVWTPPGLRHWHGATTSTKMTHIALQGSVDGTTVNWFEPVTDAQYAGTAVD